MVKAKRAPREHQARSQINEFDGFDNDLSASTDNDTLQGSQGLSLPFARRQDSTGESSLEHGHHLYSNVVWLYVLGRSDRLVQPQCAGLGDFQQPRKHLLRGGP